MNIFNGEQVISIGAKINFNKIYPQIICILLNKATIPIYNIKIFPKNLSDLRYLNNFELIEKILPGESKTICFSFTPYSKNGVKFDRRNQQSENLDNNKYFEEIIVCFVDSDNEFYISSCERIEFHLGDNKNNNKNIPSIHQYRLIHDNNNVLSSGISTNLSYWLNLFQLNNTFPIEKNINYYTEFLRFDNILSSKQILEIFSSDPNILEIFPLNSDESQNNLLNNINNELKKSKIYANYNKSRKNNNYKLNKVSKNLKNSILADNSEISSEVKKSVIENNIESFLIVDNKGEICFIIAKINNLKETIDFSLFSLENKMLELVKNRIIGQITYLKQIKKAFMSKINYSYILGKKITSLLDYLMVDWEIREIIDLLNEIGVLFKKFPEFHHYIDQIKRWNIKFADLEKISDIPQNQLNHFYSSIKEWESEFISQYPVY